MKRINLDQDIKPLSEFRANVATFVKRVRKTKRPMIITQHGRSSAVLMDVEEYELLIEKLELLQDIQLGSQQIADNKGIPHTEAKKAVMESLKQ